MIVGTGVDVCEVRRIREALQRHGDRFLARVYTGAEIACCVGRRRPEQGLAARFAAKEAAAKALGTGIAGGIAWHDCEVVVGTLGAPAMHFHGNAAELAARKNISVIHLSLSHGLDLAIASVILESGSGL